MYDDTHDVPDQHIGWLRTSLGLAENTNVPDSLIEKYWEFKNIFDRFGNGLQPRDIAMLAYAEGYGKPTAKELTPPTIVDLWRNGKVKRATPVSIVWRGKQKTGVILGVSGANLPIVLVDGDSDERTVPVKDVSVLELATA